MTLAPSRTKLVCTIGPASDSPGIMLQMLHAGMNIARLNFSHGDFAWHRTAIDNLRRAARTAGKRVTIMADLPGPKIRIRQLAEEPIELKRDDAFTLTTNEIIGDRQRVFVSFLRLPAVVKLGDVLFLNDGSIQLEVVKIEGASRGNPEANHRLEIIDLRPGRVWNNEPSQHGYVPGVKQGAGILREETRTYAGKIDMQ